MLAALANFCSLYKEFVVSTNRALSAFNLDVWLWLLAALVASGIAFRYILLYEMPDLGNRNARRVKPKPDLPWYAF